MNRGAIAAAMLACLACLAAGASPTRAEDQAPAATRAADAEPGPPRPPRDFPSFRFALVGAYRGLYDLSVLGGGASVSVGGAGEQTGNVSLRVLDGRTLGGLAVIDGALDATGERVLLDHVIIGAGGGIGFFQVTRATGGFIQSVGLKAYVRLGYRGGLAWRPILHARLRLRAAERPDGGVGPDGVDWLRAVADERRIPPVLSGGSVDQRPRQAGLTTLADRTGGERRAEGR